MAERAAHLVDHVLPDVPVRQWVLTLPHRLRYLLAWRHDLCRRVARILHAAIERHLRTWARAHGVGHAQGGGVSVLQRFGGAVNLNIHVHALVLDGVWARTGCGSPHFHAAPAPSPTDMAEVLATIVPRVRALVARDGLDEDDASDPGHESPVLAGWAATSVEGLVGAGAARRRPARLGGSGDVRTIPASVSCHAAWEGFDLHAGVRVPAGQRDRRERVCRYALRPPLAEARITITPGGDVAVPLRRPWADGTTHLVFEPGAFLARLAALVPRPRVNLLLYHGVLGPRAAWRREVVPTAAAHAIGVSTADQSPAERPTSGEGRGWRWAVLMRRVFAVDVLACARCGGRLRLIATLEASETTRRILRHLGRPTKVPPPTPARAPPGVDDWAC